MPSRVVVTLDGLPPSPNVTKRGVTKNARMQMAREVANLREDCRRVALDRVNRQRPSGIPWSAVRLEIHFGLKHIRHDPDNLIAAAKPWIDGLVDASIMISDSVRVVREFVPTYEVCGRDYVTFTVTDLAGP